MGVAVGQAGEACAKLVGMVSLNSKDADIPAGPGMPRVFGAFPRPVPP